VFLDRDGTINVEKDYLFRVEDFDFIPGVPQAIARLRRAGYLVVVVTNQSGVARGFFRLHQVEALHRHMQGDLGKHGTRVDAFYVCPHHPTEGVGTLRRVCDCRKGGPGMLLRAAAEHNIDLGRSFMIGDKAADIEAGERAGCTPLLVLTGYGQGEAMKMPAERARRFADLAGAADYILTHFPLPAQMNED